MPPVDYSTGGTLRYLDVFLFLKGNVCGGNKAGAADNKDCNEQRQIHRITGLGVGRFRYGRGVDISKGYAIYSCTSIEICIFNLECTIQIIRYSNLYCVSSCIVYNAVSASLQLAYGKGVFTSLINGNRSKGEGAVRCVLHSFQQFIIYIIQFKGELFCCQLTTVKNLSTTNADLCCRILYHSSLRMLYYSLYRTLL